MSASGFFSDSLAAKTSGNHLIPPPASGETLNIANLDGGLVEFDTNSALSFKCPAATDVPQACSFFVSNVGTGTITVQTPAAATIDTVTDGDIKEFQISSDGTWKSAGGMTAVQAALLASLNTSATGTGRIGIPLAAVSKEDGTQMIKQATTVTGFAQLSNKNIVIHIPANSTAEAFAGSIPMPSDLDLAADNTEVILDVIVSKGGALDTLTLDAEIYGIGAADAAIGSDLYAGAAVTITQAISKLSFAVGTSDGLSGSFNTVDAIAFVLTLGGTNDGDVVYIHDIAVRYPKKLLTS